MVSAKFRSKGVSVNSLLAVIAKHEFSRRQQRAAVGLPFPGVLNGIDKPDLQNHGLRSFGGELDAISGLQVHFLKNNSVAGFVGPSIAFRLKTTNL